MAKFVAFPRNRWINLDNIIQIRVKSPFAWNTDDHYQQVETAVLVTYAGLDSKVNPSLYENLYENEDYWIQTDVLEREIIYTDPKDVETFLVLLDGIKQKEI